MILAATNPLGILAVLVAIIAVAVLTLIVVMRSKSLPASQSGEPLKIIGTIRPNITQDIEAEGGDYTDAREKLLANIPEGYSLLHVRREN